MLNGKLGIAVIGCGKIAQIRHIPEYAENKHVYLVGFYDFVSERANEMARKYGGKAFSSVEELLFSSDVDAVSVCTSNTTHSEITIASLQNGKHVLCEKPMATSIEECENMVREAKGRGKILAIAHNQRLMNIHKKAKSLLRSDAIGKPLTFKTNFGHSGPDNWSIDKGTDNWFFKKQKGAFGAMGDLGCHKIDLMCYLFDCGVEETHAVITTLEKRYSNGEFVDVDDNAVAIYKMENGVVGTLTASWTYYGEEDNDTVIYGTNGIMKILAKENAINVIRKSDPPITYTVEPQKNSGVINAFIDSILANTPSPISAESAIVSMKALFATIESAKSKT